MNEEQLPNGYPHHLVMSFESQQGEEILIRPILPADAARLQELHSRLSPESIYRRFFAHRPILSDNEARKLATLDYRLSLALVAARQVEPDQLVGVARFAPSPERSQSVEMAIVVNDAYQGHGIGRRLFQELARAASELGQHWMLVETQSDNKPMIDLAERAGYTTNTVYQTTMYQIWLDLTSPRPVSL
ncbi:MAG: GNAT family N-acetyltransferase [Ardenticatenales bacterium]|nr:GNAT family N-acetyltransferase [Ardenticatenales bacterium]